MIDSGTITTIPRDASIYSNCVDPEHPHPVSCITNLTVIGVVRGMKCYVLPDLTSPPRGEFIVSRVQGPKQVKRHLFGALYINGFIPAAIWSDDPLPVGTTTGDVLVFTDAS